MRRLSPSGRGNRRHLKWIAIIIGGVFVLAGIAALAGDPEAATATTYRSTLLVRALRGLRDVFGDPGGGIAMIVSGVLLGGFLYWAAGRRS